MTPTRSRADAKRETRRALIVAGIEEFAERGLDAPSLDAICARAGFTRGAFYVHFDNREDFLTKLMEWISAGFLDRMVLADSGEGSLADVITHFIDALDRGELPSQQLGMRFGQMLEAVGRLPQIRERYSTLNHETIERVAKRVLGGQQAGTTRPDVDAVSLATVLVAAAMGGLALRDAGVSIDLAALRETVLRLVEL